MLLLYESISNRVHNYSSNDGKVVGSYQHTIKNVMALVIETTAQSNCKHVLFTRVHTMEKRRIDIDKTLKQMVAKK